VFAIGDAVNKGADIAIAVIGAAKHAAEMIDKYCGGEPISYEPEFTAKSEKTREDFADKEKLPRVRPVHRSAGERRGDFLEVNAVLSAEAAEKEAARCLECGCDAFKEKCKVIRYANKYMAEPGKYGGFTHRRDCAYIQNVIRHNPEKCILCGLCVRICEQVAGETLFGFVNRGFETVVKAVDGELLCGAGCRECGGKCADACPSGALMAVI